MNNNPLILQQLLQNFRNQQQTQPQQLTPGASLQTNLDNRLALGAGEITPEEWAIHENNRQYDIQHHPIRGRLREYDDRGGSADYFYKSLYQFPFEEIPRLFKQGIENLKGSPTGGAAPLSYGEMNPTQQGMQYRTASFSNPNLKMSDMTPAAIDEQRALDGSSPMTIDMREKLINAMRNKDLKY